jgi:hypothetical protein
MDGGPTRESEMQERLDLATRLLCWLTNDLDDEGKLTKKLKRNPELAGWWADHLKADRRRMKKEAAEQAEADFKKQAMAKLTKKERKALGVDE